MTKKLIITVLLVIVCGVMAVTSHAQVTASTTVSVTTTSIDGLSSLLDGLKFENSVDYVINDGSFHLDGALPLVTYTKNSIQWVELSVYTDFAQRVGLKADADLVPINQFLISKLGSKSGISLPFLNTIVDKYVSIKVGIGQGYNWSTGKTETIASLVILQSKF